MEQTASYDEVKAWQEGMTLAETVLRQTTARPDGADVLFREIEKDVISIPASIAEGWVVRYSTKEIRAHLNNARSAMLRLETHLMLAHRLDLLSREQMDLLWPMTQNTSGLVTALLKSV
ncbi:MAG: four helix bundle protein [Chlorobi bacterium]|nr:four helix bundle protein [Chlorobiota bacterium]